MDRLSMNFALCYSTAPKSKEESITNGFYRPYFHGELVAEYRRKSFTNSGAQKAPTDHGVEAQNHVETADGYVEPGT